MTQIPEPEKTVIATIPAEVLQRQKAFKAWQGIVGALGAFLAYSDQIVPQLSVLIGEGRAKTFGAILFIISIAWRSLMDAKDAKSLKES